MSTEQEALRRFRDCLARAEQRENGLAERIESWRLATGGDEPWPSLVLERNLAAAEVLAYRNAIAKLKARLPKVEPYRPWVVNLNPQGQRYGRIGYVTGAANGRADVAYDDGVGMQIDVKKHLTLVADLGYVEKERLRCGCGSGFPSLWCCWDKEPARRETGYAPRVVGEGGAEEKIVKVDEASFRDGAFPSLVLERADGTTYSEFAEKLSLAPRALLREPVCGCGSGKDAVRCHPMSRPLEVAPTEPPSGAV